MMMGSASRPKSAGKSAGGSAPSVAALPAMRMPLHQMLGRRLSRWQRKQQVGAAAGAQVLLLLVLVPRVAVPVVCRGLAGVGERCSQGWHAQAGRSAPRTAPSLYSVCALSPLVSSQTTSNKI